MIKYILPVILFLISVIFPLHNVNAVTVSCTPNDSCIRCEQSGDFCNAICREDRGWHSEDETPNCDGKEPTWCIEATCNGCNNGSVNCWKCEKGPPETPTPTPTVTPTPPVCESLICKVGSTLCKDTTLSPGQSITLTSAFSAPGQQYWFALYNKDHQTTPGIAEAICVLPGFSGDINQQSEACPYIPGTQTRMNHLIYREDLLTSNGSAQKTLLYGKIFVPDQNFKDNNGNPKTPSEVSINAYMIYNNDQLTATVGRCIKSIKRKIDNTPTPPKNTPTPTLTPTLTPTPVRQLSCRRIEIVVTNRSVPSITPVPVRVGDKVAFKGWGTASNTVIRYMLFKLFYKTNTTPVFTLKVPATPNSTNALYSGNTLKSPYTITKAGSYRVTVQMLER